MRPLLLAFLMVVLGSGVAAAEAKKQRVRGVWFVVVHERDGKKYPNQLKESYALERDGVLRYGAYFGGMPIDMNHNDGIEWPAGDAGKRVLDAAARLEADLTPLPDDKPVPADGIDVYVVGFAGRRGDTTRIAADRNGKAWRALHREFSALIAAFEKATGRPLTPDKLPQRPR